MKRWFKILSVLAFLGVCAGVLVFLQRFTQSPPPFTYPAWETGAVVSAGGTESEEVYDAILQDAAGRARAAGITFRASVLIPKALPFQDEELCALLMNMLDNALEGAERTPEGREKTIRFQMRVKGDFIPILCENTFDGHVETAPDGSVKTTKPDPDSHGFGLAQMRAVVEKYESILDVSWTDDHFTVQTAPQYPREG